MRRDGVAALLAGALLVVLAPAAGAHALVRTSDPANGATLPRAPSQVVVTFTEPPDPSLSYLHVLDSSGRPVTSGPSGPVAGHPLELRVPLMSLPQGVYTVTWRTVSKTDGHVTGGSFSFGVGVAPPTGTGQTGSVVSPTTPPVPPVAVAGRWAFDWGLLLLLGSAVAVLFVFRDVPRGARAALGGAWLLAAVGLTVMILSERSTVGISLTALLRSGAGQAYVRRGVALLAAGVAVGIAELRPVRSAFAAVGVVTAGTMLVHAMASHAGAAPKLTWFNVADQWVHLLAVGAWVGGLGWLLLGTRGPAGPGRSAAIRRFSWLAGVSLAVVAVTGVIRAIDEIGGLDQWRRLFRTSFGVTLLVKVGLFVALVALGARNRYANVPKSDRDPGRPASLRRTVGAELLIAVGVLGATGLLSELPPAASVALASKPAPAQQVVVAGSDFGTTVRVRLTVTPGTVGPNGFDAQVMNFDTGAPMDATGVTLGFSLPGRPELGNPSLPLRHGSGSHWTGQGTVLSMDGTWNVSVLVQEPAGSVTVPLSVRTRLPPEHITVTPGGPGQPTLYSIALSNGGMLQTYVDPAVPGRVNQVHFTFFQASGSEQPIASATATGTPPGGAAAPLKLVRFDAGHFIANTQLSAGDWRFQIVARTSDGQVFTAYFDQRIGP